MVSPWLLLIPAAGAVAVAAKKRDQKPDLVPGVPDTPQTRAYAEAVAAVEAVKAGGGTRRVFNGVSGQNSDKPKHPIINQHDLPDPPKGYHWFPYSERSDDTRAAHMTHYWHLGITPPRYSIGIPKPSLK